MPEQVEFEKNSFAGSVDHFIEWLKLYAKNVPKEGKELTVSLTSGGCVILEKVDGDTRF